MHCPVLIATRKAAKRSATVVRLTVLAGHRLTADRGKPHGRFEGWGPSFLVIRSTREAAACRPVLCGGSTSWCSAVDPACCFVGVRALVTLYVYHHGRSHQVSNMRPFDLQSALFDPCRLESLCQLARVGSVSAHFPAAKSLG